MCPNEDEGTTSSGPYKHEKDEGFSLWSVGEMIREALLYSGLSRR